jgi:acyl-coenzyme A thioesterase PaaI-like protein
MSENATPPEGECLRELVNQDVVRLIEHLRCSLAPQEVFGEATEHIQKAIELLQPWLKEGKGWSTLSLADEYADMSWDEEDIAAVMPYSPISGKHNPVAPSIHMRRDGDELRGEVTLSPTYAGPPDSVHGGIIAAVFDEILAMANVITGESGFTGTLTIKYHRRTPLNTPIELWAATVRRDGRKKIARGEMRVDGKVTASAEGLFILPAGKEP